MPTTPTRTPLSAFSAVSVRLGWVRTGHGRSSPPPTKKAPRNQKGVFFGGSPISSVVFLIGNWRWSTWGLFRETSQGLALATK